MSGFRALVVHTQPEALGELVEILSGPHLVVDTARSSTEALHKVSAIDYAVIISDHKPPELNGLDLLERTIAFCPDAMRVVLGSDPDAMAQIEVKPAGTIFRFFAKPWERRQLTGIVAEGLKLHRLEREQRELIKKLSIEYQKLQKREKLLDVVVRERTKELEESYLKLKAANRQALLGLAEAIEAKDAYTKGHCGRVAAYAMALAREAQYPEEAMEALEFASFLHDIGKIGVRDAVLLKPGPLDESEWEHMRTHPVKGYEIASQIEILKPTMPAIRNHHERWDGLGYPDGLKGDQIPLSARIVAVADAYDAMATDRPYKRGLPLEECEKLLLKNAGIMFDPVLVEIFIKRRLGALYHAPRGTSPEEGSGSGSDSGSGSGSGSGSDSGSGSGSD
ncbi:MAG: HD domain-containing protein [Deltaproteobacteria bacterium]|nr:HD domain-containing protein [Deltaproteobacteria bacterium]